MLPLAREPELRLMLTTSSSEVLLNGKIYSNLPERYRFLKSIVSVFTWG